MNKNPWFFNILCHQTQGDIIVHHMAAAASIFSSSSSSLQIFFLLIFSAIFSEAASFKSIIAFGDSLTDTGNLLHLALRKSGTPLPSAASPPYGESFFHRPTGRCSDGRLVIDFLAESLGIPLIPPYIGRGNESTTSFRQGVNFAVAGATALDQSTLEEMGIYNPQTNVSLSTELGWFKEMLPSLCQSPSECKEFLKSSLILFGEIGGNDYNYPFLDGTPIQMIQSMVPQVISTIGQIINEVIELGAQTLLVPGNVPLGCLPAYLSHFMSSSNQHDYDPRTGCINWINEFAEYHNLLLQVELDRLRRLHPHTTIIYADYYNALMQLYLSPQKYGFKSSIVACCGGKGPYHFGSSLQCGYSTATVCDDPSTSVSWDGIHSTEAAYKLMAKGLINGPYAIPHINQLCTFQRSNVEKSDH